MAEKLIPASANMPDSIKTVVEEYIFGRSKYLHKFPTMEFKTKVPEASLRGIEELDYNWKFGHAPIGMVKATGSIEISASGGIQNGDTPARGRPSTKLDFTSRCCVHVGKLGRAAGTYSPLRK